MTSETISDILDYAPNVRCYVIASVDLAKSIFNAEARTLPKGKRKQSVRYKLHRWNRSIEAFIDDARTEPYEVTHERLQSLTSTAVFPMFAQESADAKIAEVADKIRQGKYPVGIWDQFVTDHLVFVWLWVDR